MPSLRDSDASSGVPRHCRAGLSHATASRLEFGYGEQQSLHYACSSLREAHASVGMTGSSGLSRSNHYQAPHLLLLSPKRTLAQSIAAFGHQQHALLHPQ